MSIADRIKKMIKGIKSNKRLRWIAVGLAIFAILATVILMLPTEQTKASSSPAADDYEASLEAKLCSVVGAIKGVGSVNAAVTLDGSTQTVIAYTENVSANGSVSKSPEIITQSGVQSPIVLKIVYPTVIGVVIVAKGADQAAVKLRIIEAVCTLLDIEAARVSVFSA